MRVRSLIWRSLSHPGWIRHRTSSTVTREAVAADALLSEASTEAALLARDHPQSQLAQVTIEALKPEGEPVPTVPLEQLEDLDGLYQSLTSPLPPTRPTREQRNEALRRVDTNPEAYWGTREPSVEAFDHLIRACGMQGKLSRARAYFEEMDIVGLTPKASTYSALISAYALAGDVSGARAAVDHAVQEAGIEPVAPMLTGLIGAIRCAGRPAEEAHAVLGLCRRLGVIEDAPMHTAIVQAYLDQHEPDAAWKVFNQMRVSGVQADAVTFTAMLTACGMQDQLEQAHALLEDMKMDDVPSTLEVHNAYLNVCAARCRSLVQLPHPRRRNLLSLAVDLSPATPLRLADERMHTIAEEGFAPNGYTYLGLLRACASACDVPRAQRTLTRMLDTGVAPVEEHFVQVLHCCERVQVWGAAADAHGPSYLRAVEEDSLEEALRVARSVPQSMGAIGLPVTGYVLDRVLRAHSMGHGVGSRNPGRTAELHVDRAVELFHSLYAEHGLVAGPVAFDCMLRMAKVVQHPELADQLLQQMQAVEMHISDAQREVPYEIERDLEQEAVRRQRWLSNAPSSFAALPPPELQALMHHHPHQPPTARQLRRDARPAEHRGGAVTPGSLADAAHRARLALAAGAAE